MLQRCQNSLNHNRPLKVPHHEGRLSCRGRKRKREGKHVFTGHRDRGLKKKTNFSSQSQTRETLKDTCTYVLSHSPSPLFKNVFICFSSREKQASSLGVIGCRYCQFIHFLSLYPPFQATSGEPDQACQIPTQ